MELVVNRKKKKRRQYVIHYHLYRASLGQKGMDYEGLFTKHVWADSRDDAWDVWRKLEKPGSSFREVLGVIYIG